jgi:hypothetical protein
MTVSMSDRDYVTLSDAAAWVKLHSGTDAPEYLALDRLNQLIDAIASRRPSIYDPLSPREPRGRCSDLVARLFDLRDRQASATQ